MKKSMRGGLRRIWPWGLVLAHIGKLMYWFRGVDLSSPYPIINFDYIQYYARMVRAHEFFERAGRFWGYDPFQMAGYVSGPFLDVGTYFFSVVAHWLSPFISIRTTLLFFTIFVFFVAPFCIWIFVKCLGGSSTRAWVAFGLAVLAVGHLEFVTRGILFQGLLGYQMAAYLAFIQVGLLWMWCHEQKLSTWFFLVVVSAVLFQIHPAVLLIVCVPNLLLYGAFFRNLRVGAHVALVLGLMVVLAANWYWIEPYWAFSEWMDRATYFESRGFLGLWKDFGPFQPTYFNFGQWIFTMILIWLTSVSLRSHAWTLVEVRVLVGWIFFLLFVGYFGNWLPLIRSLQPSRILMAMTPLLCALASFSFGEKIWKVPSRRLGFSVFVLFVGAFLFVQTDELWNTLSNQPRSYERILFRFFQKRAPLDGRILIGSSDSTGSHVGDFLPLVSGRSVLGGPHPGNFTKGRFTLFTEFYWDGEKLEQKKPMIFGRPLKGITEEELAKYLELYNVRLIMAREAVTIDLLNKFKRIFIQNGRVGRYNLYWIPRRSNWFFKGTGTVSFDYDQIQIKNPSAGELILKFHWIKTFQTHPSVPLKPVQILDDPMPFIQIDNSAGFSEIRIVNEGL